MLRKFDMNQVPFEFPLSSVGMRTKATAIAIRLFMLPQLHWRLEGCLRSQGCGDCVSALGDLGIDDRVRPPLW